MMRSANLAAAVLFALAAAPLAAAPSNYGCANLDEASPPVVEGQDGVFFRLKLDFRMNQPLSEDAAKLVGDMARALRARGTELVYVPVPAKSLAMPDKVPAGMSSYGFDQEIAEVAYDAFIAKMAAAGVTTVDTLRAMRTVEGNAFQPTDFHWSPEGARAVAGAVADTIRAMPAYDELEKTTYETEATEVEPMLSKFRSLVQSYCRETVPPAVVQGYKTTRTSSGDTSGGIFASDASGPPIALTGTSMSAESSFHFEGFLADASELAVANYSITGGNQFGGITTYLMSEDFRENPPAVLVWENPIYNNLGEFGETPLRELLGPIGTACEPLETKSPDPLTMVAHLPDGVLRRDSYIEVDTGSPNGRDAVTAFVTQNGVTSRTPIRRPVRYAPTRWFYQYVEPIWRDDFTSIEVTVDRPVTDDAKISLCEKKETSS